MPIKLNKSNYVVFSVCMRGYTNIYFVWLLLMPIKLNENSLCCVVLCIYMLLTYFIPGGKWGLWGIYKHMQF